MGSRGVAAAAAWGAPLTWTPMERRLTPAALKPSRADALVELGLASSVTSAPAGRWAAPATASNTAATVPGLARLGVPPPKKTEVTLWGRGWEAAGGQEGPSSPPEPTLCTHLCTWLRRSRVCASRTRQARTAASSTAGTTYVLKLQ